MGKRIARIVKLLRYMWVSYNFNEHYNQGHPDSHDGCDSYVAKFWRLDYPLPTARISHKNKDKHE